MTEVRLVVHLLCRAVATTHIGDAATIFIVSASGVTWKDEQDKVMTPTRTFTAI